MLHLYKNVTIDTEEGVSIVDVTRRIEALVTESTIRNGMVVIASRHTTTALAINEYEARLLEDIKHWLEQLAPSDAAYKHNDIHLRDCPPDEPENAHSHLAAMMLGSSESIPVVDGELMLGQWQSVLFFELDGPRERGLSVQVMGE